MSDRVAADMRLKYVKGLQVDESALTGVSVPVHKALEPVAPDIMLGDPGTWRIRARW